MLICTVFSDNNYVQLTQRANDSPVVSLVHFQCNHAGLEVVCHEDNRHDSCNKHFFPRKENFSAL